jgi:putative peptidoglycan lipid II flippase
MSSLLRSTGIVALATLASRILGFIRDMVMASYFGATGMTDAFYVAFKIPNLFRRFVAEGALSISFIPVYTEYLVNRGGGRRWSWLRRLSSFSHGSCQSCSAGEIFSPQIVSSSPWVSPTAPITIWLSSSTASCSPYLFFISLVAFAMGVLIHTSISSRRHFLGAAEWGIITAWYSSAGSSWCSSGRILGRDRGLMQLLCRYLTCSRPDSG